MCLLLPLQAHFSSWLYAGLHGIFISLVKAPFSLYLRQHCPLTPSICGVSCDVCPLGFAMTGAGVWLVIHICSEAVHLCWLLWTSAPGDVKGRLPSLPLRSLPGFSWIPASSLPFEFRLQGYRVKGKKEKKIKEERVCVGRNLVSAHLANMLNKCARAPLSQPHFLLLLSCELSLCTAGRLIAGR